MNKGVLIALMAVSAGVVAMTIARGMSEGSNLEKRQKHWEQEVPGKVPVGTSKEDLEAFIVAQGEKMKCYSNEKRQSICEFEDRQSFGGSRSMPMRLSVAFVMKDDAVASYQYVPGFVDREPR